MSFDGCSGRVLVGGQTDGGPCIADGSGCDVMCGNGDRAGTKFWNGSVWTDVVKPDEGEDTEASAICEASGTACT